MGVVQLPTERSYGHMGSPGRDASPSCLGSPISVASVQSERSVRSFVAENATPYMEVLMIPWIAVFAVCTFLRFLANTTITPLLGQIIATGSGRSGLAWMAAIVIMNEAIAIGMTYIARHLMESIGYKQTILIGFVALPMRCISIAAFYELEAGPVALLSTQI